MQTSDGSTFVLCEEKAAEFNWTSESLVDRKLSQLNPLDHLLSKETCLSQKLSLNKVRGLVHRMVSLYVVETELGGPTDVTCNQILADDMMHYPLPRWNRRSAHFSQARCNHHLSHH